ncbi:hypothetical protein AB0N62_46020 [Streptomyces sp. NPDC093982]|uniref:hypothetical protein n=1 Tax=Streptomyces sp. NPDC093982 TaxID=3155077 RepID=UPI0034153B87
MTTIKPGPDTVINRMIAACAGGVAAVVLLVAGCSGGDGQNARSAESPSAATSATTEPARTGSDKDTAEKDADDANRIPPGPKVPRSELTPATGSITKEQKKYLTDRVPKGVDPAAILEAGQEACDRITSIAARDRKAAIKAIQTGEITGARDAVTQLCPEHKPLLKEAEK